MTGKRQGVLCYDRGEIKGRKYYVMTGKRWGVLCYDSGEIKGKKYYVITGKSREYFVMAWER